MEPSPDQIRDALEQIAEVGVPASGLAWITDVGTAEYLRFFRSEILDDLISHGGATCRFFEAVYGAGKTHLLDLLYVFALENDLAVVRTDLSQAIRLDDWRLVTRHILENVTARIDGADVDGIPRILEEYAGTNADASSSIRKARLPHPGFANAMALLLDGGPSSHTACDAVHQFLYGERIGAGYLRRFGVNGIADPLSQRNAEQVLSTVLNALRLMGLRGNMLLFDENERTLESPRAVPSRRVVTAANLIRRFIDSCVMGDLPGTVAVYGVLPGFLNRCAHAYAALGQRLHTEYPDNNVHPWRWPVLPASAILSTNGPDGFADAIVERVVYLIELCGGSTHRLRSQMRHAAQEVLERHAGEAYRRPLLKRLSALALEEL